MGNQIIPNALSRNSTNGIINHFDFLYKQAYQELISETAKGNSNDD